MSFMSLSTTWVKESSSEEEYTKFKQVAPINKILKEKLQKPIREKKTSEVETTTKFSDDDWYVWNIFSRAQILTFLFVGENHIRNELHQPHKQGFIALFNEKLCENQNFPRRCKLLDVKWKDLQDTLKAMRRKLENKRDFKSFEKGARLGKILYSPYLS